MRAFPNSRLANSEVIPHFHGFFVARMAELVDALDSKSSSREEVRVRPPLRVPYKPSFFMEASIRRGRESDMPALQYQPLHRKFRGYLRDGGNVPRKSKNLVYPVH